MTDTPLTRCDGCFRGFPDDALQFRVNTETGEQMVLCLTCDPPPPSKRGRKPRTPDGAATQSTLGPSKTVTFRLPLTLVHRLERLALALYQPVPVVIRAALAEYLDRHKPSHTASSGLTITWASASPEVTHPETPVTPASSTTSTPTAPAVSGDL